MTSAKLARTHQLVPSPPHRHHFVVVSTNFFVPPSTPTCHLQEESFAMCHTFLLTLIHMQIRILCVDFSLLRPRLAEVAQGCITCQYLHPVEASWRLALMPVPPQCAGPKTRILFSVAALFSPPSVLSQSVSLQIVKYPSAGRHALPV